MIWWNNKKLNNLLKIIIPSAEIEKKLEILRNDKNVNII